MDWLNMMLGLIRENGRMSDTFKAASGKTYYVDSNNTLDHGYETMVFECDENGNVTSWRDLDCELYDSLEDMQEGHDMMVEKWKAM